MYENYYNLKAMPFQITTDPRFLWLGEKHTEALATLKYGIMENKGFLLMIGDVGTGKTALINCLVKMIDVSAIVAKIPDPGLSSLDFFNFLAIELKIYKKFDSKGAFLIYLKQYLLKAHSLNKKVLLIIDEAQRLNHELLEQIRLLSNIELDSRKLINIFFVGQTEFSQMLLEERNRAVRQRITVSYHIEPLTESETRAYIKHRLKIAGTTKEIFSKDAIREIFSFSAGYPRLINIVCDHALLTGYVSGLKSIDQKVIQECEKELQIPLVAGDEDEIGSNENATHQNKSEAPAPEKTSGLKRIGVIAAIIILLVLGISFFTNQKTGEKPSRNTYEIAPPDDKDPLPQKSQEQEGYSGQPSEATDVEPIAETPPGERLVREENQAFVGNERVSTSVIQQPASEDETDTQVRETAVAQVDRENIVLKDSPEIVPPVERHTIIYFKHNSNELPNQSYEALNKIADFMLKTPSASLDIKGYSDSTGDYSYNMHVSRFRANTIKIFMVGKGVDPARIQTSGLGPENPIASNETMEGRRKNRRVELDLTF
jgi:general secretion pathway protein A